MARRYPRALMTPPAVDEPAAILRHARKLAGEESDPFYVSDALFRAAFTSLVRLPPEDDRRHRLISHVHERAYDLLATGGESGSWAAAPAAASKATAQRAPLMAHRP